MLLPAGERRTLMSAKGRHRTRQAAANGQERTTMKLSSWLVHDPAGAASSSAFSHALTRSAALLMAWRCIVPLVGQPVGQETLSPVSTPSTKQVPNTLEAPGPSKQRQGQWASLRSVLRAATVPR